MAIVYTKPQFLAQVDEWLTPETVRELYRQNFVNYTGITADTKEKYTEVIATRLLSNLDVLEGIERITRKSSYKTACHKCEPIDLSSCRREEQTARSMMGQTFDYIGKVIDYQTPLKDVQSDAVGKIDMMSWNEAEGCVYIFEFKASDSTETLLRCVLEIDTYSRIVDSGKLLDDFKVPAGTVLRKAALIYQGSRPYADFGDTNVKLLMEELGVDLFVLDANGRIRYCEALGG